MVVDRGLWSQVVWVPLPALLNWLFNAARISPLLQVGIMVVYLMELWG